KVPELITAIVMLDPPGPGFLARLDSSPYFTIWSAMRKFAGRKDVPGVAKALAELQVPTAAPGETRRLGDMRDADSLRYMARCQQDLDAEAMTPALEKKWLEGFDVFAIAKQVKCAAMLVVSDLAQGGMLPPDDAKALASALPDCTRVDLPGVGHLVHWQ